jgi:hypothetical protein
VLDVLVGNTFLERLPAVRTLAVRHAGVVATLRLGR